MSFEGYLPLDHGMATRAIHASQNPEQWNSKSVATPIFTTSVFKLDGQHYDTAYQYGRWGNPTRENLEGCIASLENSKYALTFATGCAAISSALKLLHTGDHVLCSSDVYGGTYQIMHMIAEEKKVDVGFFDAQRLDVLQKQMKPTTKMVWIESPTNPMCKIVDIRKVAEIVHKVPGAILVVDNTYMSPYFSKPLALGADIVMHSMTKYMNGHSDVIMGALLLNDEKNFRRLESIQKYAGAVPGSFDCYLALRGLKTLPVRMRQHMSNSLQLAKHLEKHPQVEDVIHPGLPSHPDHDLMKSQTSGCSGMMAFRIKGAGEKETHKFLRSLKMVVFAASLGGVESLASAPAFLSHRFLSPEDKIKAGVTDNLIRLSVGIEDIADIIKDIDQAIKEAFRISNTA